MTSWSQAPIVDVRPRPLQGWEALAFTLWVAVVGPWLRATSLPASRPLQVALVGSAASIASVVTPGRAWWARLVLAAATAGVLFGSQGATISLWLAGGLVLAAWVGQDRPPLPALPHAGPGNRAVVGFLVGVAAWIGADATHTWQPAVPLALAFALVLLSRVGGGVLDRLGRRLGAAVASIVATILFTLLGIVVLLVPWLVQRAVRHDPLHPRAGWGARDRRPVLPSRPWTTEPVPRPRHPATTLVVAGVLAIATIAGGTVLTRRDRPGAGPPAADLLALADTSAPVPDAQRGRAWYPAYRADIAWLLDEKVGLRPFEVYRLHDAATRTVNVRGGDRASWEPTACDCPEVTLWWYGGAAAFGLEQRDDHTIVSELSRLAARDGIALDVVNRAIPGQLHWRNALRFSWDLIHEPAPDLAVFYEGPEEVDAAEGLSAKGLGDDRGSFEPFVDSVYDQVEDVPAEPLPPPDAVEVPTTSPPLAPDAIGRLAVARYVRSLQFTDDASHHWKVPVRYVWAPSRYAGGAPAAEDRARADAFAAAAGALPSRIVDLTQVFEDEARPLFVGDDTHNELGARLVAAELYRRLRPQVRELAARRGGR